MEETFLSKHVKVPNSVIRAQQAAERKKSGNDAEINSPRHGKQPFFRRHKYFFIFYLLLVVYHFCVSSAFAIWETDAITFTNHIVDFSFGFCTKFLPGAIFQLFFKEPTRFNTSLYETVLLLGFLIILCGLLDHFIRSVPEAYTRMTFFLIVFFLIGPCTFSMLFNELGLLDAYWIYFAILFVLFLQYRFLRPLLPVLGFLTVLVHFSSVFCYILFFAFLILYELSFTKKKEDRIGLWCVFVLTVVVSAGTALYFVAYEKSNLVYKTVESFEDALNERGAALTLYFKYAFFEDYSFIGVQRPETMTFIDNSPLPDWMKMLLNSVFIQLKYCWEIYKDKSFVPLFVFFGLFLSIAPLAVLIYKSLGFLYKQNGENRLKRFSFLCAFLYMPVSFLLCALFSPDPRWVSHSFLPLFSFFLYVLYREKEKMLPFVKAKIQEIRPSLISLYFLIYSLFVYHPYI